MSTRSPVSRTRRPKPLFRLPHEPEVQVDYTSEFTEGVPMQVTTSMSVKLSTLQYESVDYFASISQTLREGGDPHRAVDQGYAFLNKKLKPKVEYIHQKFRGIPPKKSPPAEVEKK